MVNRITLVGNLGRDPELLTTESGRHRTTFPVATNRRYTNGNGELVEEVTWHRIVTWGKLAETCNQYLEKGRLVYVEGRVRNYQTTPPEGDPVWRTEVVANVVRFLGKKNGNGAPAAEAPPEGENTEEVPF